MGSAPSETAWGPGPSEGVQWQGRPRGRASCDCRQTHPQRLQYPQLPPGCITKVSQKKHFGCLKYGLHTILRLYFTSSFSNTQARFYGIWGILLNDLVVHFWPDRAFPDLDYKRKTASGKFSCRSMDTCTTVPSPSTGRLYPRGTHTVKHIRQRRSWVVAFMTVGSICTGTVLLSHSQHCS